MSGKGTLNNMNRTLIGILCQKIWLHACFTFQSISLSLIFNCGINHSPTKKTSGSKLDECPWLWKAAIEFHKVVIWNQIKKRNCYQGWIKSFWLCGFIISTKTSQPVMISERNKTGDRQCRKTNLWVEFKIYWSWNIGTVLGRLFFNVAFFDAFGILRCSWCMEYLPAIHWNCWLRLCGEMARHADPHWIDEQALKPHDSRKLGGLAWQGMEPFWERRVSELFCVWETMMCFWTKKLKSLNHGEKNSYSYTTHHNPSTSWKKDRLILIIPRMDPRLLHVTW